MYADRFALTLKGNDGYSLVVAGDKGINPVAMHMAR